MKLGILGGTFDPVHNGHLTLARTALDELQLDRVLLIPSAVPPHKGAVTASAAERLAMVELACRGVPGVESSDLELTRPGPSYTVDTLEELRRRHPGAELYFILGEDTLPELPTWREAARIPELATLVVAPRPRTTSSTLSRTDAPSSLPHRRLSMAPVDLSSTTIRAGVRAGDLWPASVPAAVAKYIRQKRLYTT